MGVSCRCPEGPGIVADCFGVFCRCSAGLGDCVATSQTVKESPACTLNAKSGQSCAFLESLLSSVSIFRVCFRRRKLKTEVVIFQNIATTTTAVD
ncbi:hypothetical protein DPMN_124647 [Dreissena polymorpha]|uniref:Uncharacterized protein n=1 Tax=Dreissena polymorpha TaxID=45954 RepID=A0A9D4GWF3_DREPO|nr:hypothetical protein DPMN_124647 [Dreissena polymorpha]